MFLYLGFLFLLLILLIIIIIVFSHDKEGKKEKEKGKKITIQPELAELKKIKNIQQLDRMGLLDPVLNSKVFITNPEKVSLRMTEQFLEEEGILSEISSENIIAIFHALSPSGTIPFARKLASKPRNVLLWRCSASIDKIIEKLQKDGCR